MTKREKILKIVFSVLLLIIQVNLAKATGIIEDPLLNWAYGIFGDGTIARGFLTLLIIVAVSIVPLIKNRLDIAMILGVLGLLYCTAKGYCEIWVTVVLCLIASFFLAKAFKDIIEK